jgi:hypothetical protein
MSVKKEIISPSSHSFNTVISLKKRGSTKKDSYSCREVVNLRPVMPSQRPINQGNPRDLAKLKQVLTELPALSPQFRSLLVESKTQISRLARP